MVSKDPVDRDSGRETNSRSFNFTGDFEIVQVKEKNQKNPPQNKTLETAVDNKATAYSTQNKSSASVYMNGANA